MLTNHFCDRTRLQQKLFWTTQVTNLGIIGFNCHLFSVGCLQKSVHTPVEHRTHHITKWKPTPFLQPHGYCSSEAMFHLLAGYLARFLFPRENPAKPLPRGSRRPSPALGKELGSGVPNGVEPGGGSGGLGGSGPCVGTCLRCGERIRPGLWVTVRVLTAMTGHDMRLPGSHMDVVSPSVF